MNSSFPNEPVGEITSQTLVSFIVTNYNYGEYLYQAVESIAQQGWQRIEVVLIDDGSTDNSRRVIEDAQDDHKLRFDRFEFIPLTENRGKLNALNLGIECVRGPVTIILDADDTIVPEFTEKTVLRLKQERRKDNAVAFIYTDCMYTYPSGENICAEELTDFSSSMLDSQSSIPETAPTLTAVLKSEGVTPFDPTIRVGTKYHKWKRILNKGWTGVYLPEPLLKYRMHDRNLSGIGEIVLKRRTGKNAKFWVVSHA